MFISYFKAWAYMTGASVTCAISALSSLICFFGTRELNFRISSCPAGASASTDTVAAAESREADDSGLKAFLASAKRVLTYRPYMFHMAAFLFLSLGIQVRIILFWDVISF